jgi:AAA-like domain
MRKFSSYGPIKVDLHYHAPRTALIDQIYAQLLGENPDEDGHYITIWAPRQTGKSWVTNQALHRLKEMQPAFDVVKLSLQDLQDAPFEKAIDGLIQKLSFALERELPSPDSQDAFAELFSRRVLEKPLILILDEFDSLSSGAIQGIVGAFRNIYNLRFQEDNKSTGDKQFLLHGLALIGVRAVLGIGNRSGSPFNVQRSVRIPNLTAGEVEGIFHWYERESGQIIEPTVIDRIYYEMRGQPGLTCWLGELLTETYNRHQPTLTMQDFEATYAKAINTLPNNNILNIISKAKEPEYKPLVLELFDTNSKIFFRYDDPSTTFLYLNGVVEQETSETETYYLKFSSPFVQKRLFNYFSYELYGKLGRLYDPFDNLENTITETTLQVPNLLRRYEAWLQQNRTRLLRDAPRRASDDRIFEAVFHFNLYMYLSQFLATYHGQVLPEFPTGNGKIDLLIRYAGTIYGLEVKSFLNAIDYRNALGQAARYANQLQLSEIWLVLFVDAVNDENRQRYQVTYTDATTGVTVYPLFVVTG